MKFIIKKVLAGGLTIAGATLLASCNILNPKQVAPEQIENLNYDQASSVLSWDSLENAERYVVVYNIKDRGRYIEEEKNNVSLETKTSFVYITLDRETMDGDEITFQISAYDKDRKVIGSSWVRDEVAYKNEKDLVEGLDYLKSVTKTQIEKSLKGQGFVLDKIVQFDIDDQTEKKALYMKYLAKNEEGKTHLFISKIDIKSLHNDYDIQGLLKIFNENKHSWTQILNIEVFEDKFYDQYISDIKKVRGNSLIGSALSSSAKFSKNFHYLSKPVLLEGDNFGEYKGSWAIYIFSELHAAYTAPMYNGFNYDIKADFIVVLPKTEEIKSPEDALAYYEKYGNRKEYISFQELPSQLPPKSLFGPTIDTFNGIIEHRKQQEEKTQTNQKVTYTFILPELANEEKKEYDFNF